MIPIRSHLLAVCCYTENLSDSFIVSPPSFSCLVNWCANTLEYYLDGQAGLPKDPKQAMVCFKKAADAGDHWAMAKLGEMYLTIGSGNANADPSADNTQAFQLLTKAANQGIPKAQFYLGTKPLSLSYFTLCVPLLFSRAVCAWHRCNVSGGHTSRKDELNVSADAAQGSCKEQVSRSDG